MFCIITADFEKVEFALKNKLEKYGYLNCGFLKILYRFQQGSFVHYFKRLNIDVKFPNITKTAQQRKMHKIVE